MKKLLALVFILTLISTIFASIDYNMIYDADGMGYDADNGKYKVKLQIKSNDGTQPVGFFNLRILYNNACLTYNMGESYSTGPIEDWIAFGMFDVYNLIPVEMSSIKCGINGVYTGSNTNPGMCYYLDNTWTDCAVLVFDVADASQSTNLRWDISGVQNQITLYDASPVPNGTYTGDHDVVLDGGTGPTPAGQGILYFSEISDNLFGQAETTAFIEVKNVTANEVDLTGVTVVNVSTAYTVNLSGTVPAYGAVIITNGADQAAFEAAWTVTLDMTTTVFVQGDTNIGIGDGYAYTLNVPDVRAQIDDTPVVNNNERVIQTQPEAWTAPSQPDQADPGDDSPGQSLPVEFAAFNVAVESSELVSIEWSTKTETDLIGFRIFRSLTSEMNDAIPLNGNELIEATNTSGDKDYKHNDTDVTFGTTYYYWIEVVQADNNIGGFHGPQSVTINKDSVAPIASTSLASNYPNPFNPDTKIEFSIKGEIGEMVDASLVIYNIKGQKVKTLFDKIEVKENDFRMWNGTDDNDNPVSSGVYFYKLQTPDYTKTSKMVLMK